VSEVGGFLFSIGDCLKGYGLHAVGCWLRRLEACLAHVITSGFVFCSGLCYCMWDEMVMWSHRQHHSSTSWWSSSYKPLGCDAMWHGRQV